MEKSPDVAPPPPQGAPQQGGFQQVQTTTVVTQGTIITQPYNNSANQTKAVVCGASAICITICLFLFGFPMFIGGIAALAISDRWVRPHSLYSTVDESSYELETGPTRKKLTIQFSPPTVINIKKYSQAWLNRPWMIRQYNNPIKYCLEPIWSLHPSTGSNGQSDCF